MDRKKLLFGMVLLFLGIIGIISLLTMEIQLPPDAETALKDKFTAGQIKLLTLINPTILLLVSVLVGTLLFQRVNLTVPLIEKMVGIKSGTINLSGIIKYGVLGGVLAGVLLTVAGLIFDSIIPLEFKELGQNLQPSLAARFLYGGLTEEILMRFGLMTFLVWLCSKIFRGIKPVIYWIGILVSALIFAFGHFPIVYQSVQNPSTGLLTYILTGNSIGGIIFGWLYWKKGLESAFIAHLFAHVIMVSAQPFFN